MDHLIYERTELRFDIERLRELVTRVVLPLPPTMHDASFGGWSVLSADGTFQDGWQAADLAFDPNYMPNSTLEEKLLSFGARPSYMHTRPTSLCVEYLAEVIEAIRAAGLNPTRARVSLLKAHGKSKLHRDAPDNQYAVRLHVPIITNDRCFFECEDGSAHLPADGSAYLLRVNRMHRVINDGEQDRLHLIMSVQDTTGVSKYHRKPH